MRTHKQLEIQVKTGLVENQILQLFFQGTLLVGRNTVSHILKHCEVHTRPGTSTSGRLPEV